MSKQETNSEKQNVIDSIDTNKIYNSMTENTVSNLIKRNEINIFINKAKRLNKKRK